MKNYERARQHINGWAQKQTQDRIKDLIPHNGVNETTRLALVNAVYFKANWESQFEVSKTRPSPFHLTSTDKKDVPTMNREGVYRFAEQGHVRVLEMPYEAKDTSMVLLLPDAVDGLPALEQSLTAAELDRYIEVMTPELVTVSLPKFQVNPPSSIRLRETLMTLGMRLAFDIRSADFTGIANPQKTRDRLYVSEVFHKAFVELGEKGTEAAAATAVVMARDSGLPPKPKVFRADHPFLFVLRDTKTGMILFMGRVADPSSR
uniref:Serin protease inhibitor protein n=1 Tax=Polyangium spumosum TaxID=889282 RepID=A0A173H0U6_9BACT|nr:serin protease inhibitor protein [Polyangium spumosum]